MNNKLLSLIAALIIIILAVWGFTAALDHDDDDKDDDKDDNTTSIVEDDGDEDDTNTDLSEAPEADSAADATALLQSLVGEKEGTASLLLSTLTFPESVMTTGADQTFTLESKGFDLAILGNESLAIEQGVYPLAQVAVEGEVMMTNGNVSLKVESLTPSFYVASPNGGETPLDSAVQTQILAGLEAAGIVIPEVTPTSPVSVPVEITPNTDGGFEIASTAEAPLFALFTTK